MRFWPLLLIAFTLTRFSYAQNYDDFDVNLYFDDDYHGFNFWGDDRAYTAGWRLSFVKALTETPQWTKPYLSWLIDSDSEINFGIALGQQMYTPADLTRSDLITDDEPYAGYLFSGASLQVRNKNVLDSFEIDLGIVGPPALAQQAQTLVHSAFGMIHPAGWDNQLHTEPTVQLFYQRKMRVWDFTLEGDNAIVDVVHFFEAALGNVYIYGGTGAQVRVGYHLADTFGPTVLTPVGVDQFVAEHSHLLETYFFFSAEGRLMARNIFLDGNTFQSSPSITKVPEVYDLDFGLVLRIGEIRASWREILRSREFTPEPKAHPFAALALTFTHRL